MYLKKIEGQTSKYALPMHETDFSNLSATYTTAGSLDSFRDETMNYIRALIEVDLSVKFYLYPREYNEFEARFQKLILVKKRLMYLLLQ
ncbi:hypothetical protein GCM10010896_21020 [Mammaliicoccus stepanovicii]|uniref:Lipase n=1 Tax=Mammaliicoccus stepanovicii TaxID=643214 RepID=A0A239XXE5_9STAP|nr:hypothetical protein CD111_00040 [Mammaliicoccus stepanovicii]GGI42959.1 hypothetical protein GCM10010896_21020 [Mammaliicoccus stepanovicii]SNV51661.1 Lipase [Mammaliicoccus stepanovicii]